MADGRPVLLVVDDAHWADPASVELIAHLARRPVRTRLLVVVAFRPAQASERLLRALAGRPRVTLGPLSRAEAGELLRDVPASRRDDVYERAGGNPLFLEALSRSGGVPETVLDALADELAARSPDALALARGGAVAGEPFAPELAAAAAGLDDPAALAALDELLAAELVHACGPREFRFRHPIVRQAIYAPRRRGLAARRPRSRGRGARAPGRRRRCGAPTTSSSARSRVTARRSRCSGGRGGRRRRALPRPPRTGGRRRCGCCRRRASDDARLALLVPMATALGAAGELAPARDALHEVARRSSRTPSCAGGWSRSSR